MVLYLGNVMEIAPAKQLYKAPGHPYTEALISAVPIPDPALEKAKEVMLLDQDLPSPLNPPSGCVFRTRCPIAEPRCAEVRPVLEDKGNGQFVACHLR
jgi:oligopeptide transport system ATP-binding protein